MAEEKKAYKYKKTKENGKNDTGRPTVFTEIVLTELKRAFSVGASDVEACLMADISPAALYNYQHEHPDFVEQKDKLKKSLLLHSRQVIARKIVEENDADLAKWYLERKAKSEFSTRQEITGENGESLIPKIEILPVAVVNKEEETLN